MPSFRWPYVSHDVVLATEVATARPTNRSDWKEVATTLSAAFSTPQKQVSLKNHLEITPTHINHDLRK